MKTLLYFNGEHFLLAEDISLGAVVHALRTARRLKWNYAEKTDKDCFVIDEKHAAVEFNVEVILDEKVKVLEPEPPVVVPPEDAPAAVGACGFKVEPVSAPTGAEEAGAF